MIAVGSEVGKERSNRRTESERVEGNLQDIIQRLDRFRSELQDIARELCIVYVSI